jgi:prepilin-type N-terminal cleavage/methylation domain-containing protein
MKLKRKKINLGFTLIESLVAVGLFGLIISVAVGGFVKALRTQSQITALLSANGNASLAMEQIAREVRTGYDFSCTKNLKFGLCDQLSFVNAQAQNVVYDLKADNSGRGYIEKITENVPASITADNVNVKYLVISLEGEAKGDGEPPRATISIGVAPAGDFGEISVTRIQTTVSARESD